jgi:hypothetical protein
MPTSKRRLQPGGRVTPAPSMTSSVSSTTSCGFWRPDISAVAGLAKRWGQQRSCTRYTCDSLTAPVRISWTGITSWQWPRAQCGWSSWIIGGANSPGNAIPRRPVSANVGEVAAPNALPFVDILALDESLRRLSALDARQAQIVELRFFGGLTLDEIAAMFGVSERTAKREWQKARAFLYHAMRSAGDEPDA